MEFENGLLSTEFKSSINCMNLGCGKYCSCPPSDKYAYVNIHATLQYVQEEDGESLLEEVKKIGVAHLQMFNENMYSDFLELANIAGEDLEVVVSSASATIEDYRYWSTFVVLDNLEIIESMRSKGAGSLFVKAIQEYVFKVLNSEALLLTAGNRHIPIDAENKKASTEKLIDFYEKFGFKVFEKDKMYIAADSFWENDVCDNHDL